MKGPAIPGTWRPTAAAKIFFFRRGKPTTNCITAYLIKLILFILRSTQLYSIGGYQDNMF
jgi:hypothetical protein